jgi:hypothetical protein
MRILLDESLPHDLAALILDHQVSTVRQEGQVSGFGIDEIRSLHHRRSKPRVSTKLGEIAHCRRGVGR